MSLSKITLAVLLLTSTICCSCFASKIPPIPWIPDCPEWLEFINIRKQLTPEMDLQPTIHDNNLHGLVKSMVEEIDIPKQGKQDGYIIKTTFNYDKNGRLTKKIDDSSGIISLYEADKKGRLNKIHKYLPYINDWSENSIDRNSRGQVLTDGDNAWEYDSKGRVKCHLLVRSEVIACVSYTYDYDSIGRIKSEKIHSTDRDEGNYIPVNDYITYKYRGRTVLIGCLRVICDSKWRVNRIINSHSVKHAKWTSVTIRYDKNRIVAMIFKLKGKTTFIARVKYDRWGNVVEQLPEADYDDEFGAAPVCYSYKYDSRGNWIERKSSDGEIVRRTITYY